jgi:hypothetical protein
MKREEAALLLKPFLETLQNTYEFLKKHLSIRHYIRAPELTWHGFSQFFVIPDDQDLFYFDLSFTKVS